MTDTDYGRSPRRPYYRELIQQGRLAKLGVALKAATNSTKRQFLDLVKEGAAG